MNKEAFRMIQERLSFGGQPSCTGRLPEEVLKSHRVTAETQLTPMEHLFRLFDTPCFYRGELTAVCGRAKSGKTFFLSLIMAMGLRPDRDEGRLPLIRERDSPLKILWIDTEQSAQSTQDILVNRIVPMASSDSDLYAYNLRGVGFEARLQLTGAAISMVKPDLVVLDGIKDLMTDINDAVQATLLMEQLMALAQHHQCCIVNVLHQNKNEADKNMRGSIGTELTNKAFEVFQCEYLEESDVFKVKQSLSRRHRLRRKLYYTLGADRLPEACDSPNEQPRDAHGRWMSNKPQAAAVKWESFNQRYIIHHDDGSYTWNLAQLFEDAFEGHSSRVFGHLMAAALRLSHIQDKNYYYALFNEAERQGLILKQQHPDTGETWVEMKWNKLPF